MNIMPRIAVQNSDQQRRINLRRSIIQRYARIGGQLFGAVPKGHDRQFFCLDEHTWIWHEAWTDKSGQRHVITTRYEVRPDGILKVQDGQTYQRLSAAEARNLYHSVELYRQKVNADYYRLTQPAPQA